MFFVIKAEIGASHYDSPGYQEIIHLRTDKSEGSLVFAGGFVMPTEYRS